MRRFADRQRASGGDVRDLARKVRDGCDRMDASDFADVCVDTTGVPAGEAARLVRDRCCGWPGFAAVGGQPGTAPAGPGRPAGSQAHGCGGQVLLLCGPAGVGKAETPFVRQTDRSLNSPGRIALWRRGAGGLLRKA